MNTFISFLGLIIFLILAYAFSENRKRIQSSR
ncbi:MAG: hypothetical protein KAI43_11530 [Candidatus Aureabacteria bacterium]|nr:hypothetical protein [Candidatus Auribacterota bacterium]